MLIYTILFSMIGIVFLIEWKHFKFHLHHSQLGLVFLPGVIYKTKFSMFFQAILLGIFVNGAVIWGMTGSVYDVIGT